MPCASERAVMPEVDMPEPAMPESRSHRRITVTAGWILGILIGLVAAGDAGAAVPTRFHQDEPPPLTGLVGTSMTDVVWSGRYLWVATERGLARWDPTVGDGLSAGDWVTFTEENGLGRGAVSALAASGDTVWAATLFDSLVIAADGPVQTGSGLSWSTDAGASWGHVPNAAIFDTTKAGFEGGPTLPFLNACFGLALDGDTVWATFLAGSAVRSRDFGRTWERVLPGGAERIVLVPSDNQVEVGLLRFSADSLEAGGGPATTVDSLRAAADSVASFYLLHRTFSVSAYGDTVWIGTSHGLASSFDGGENWAVHRVRVNDFGEALPGNPGGNWAVTVEREVTADGGSAIWSGTRVVNPGGERSTMNVTRDNGTTWESTGPVSAWDFAFTGSDTVWAGTDEGLLMTPDHGRTWVEVPVVDPRTRDLLLPSFVGVERFDLPGGQTVLWAGADNGLGRSDDGGQTWTILSFPVKTRSLDSGEFIGAGGLVDMDGVRTYAAPSPFSPSQSQRARIVYSLAEDARVTIEIYDFASRHVRTLVDGADRAGGRNHGESWDGTDTDGRPVANGTYFFRVETDAGDQAFGNVVVLD